MLLVTMSSRREKVVLILGATLFGSFTFVIQPYWDSIVTSEKSVDGQIARETRETDTVQAVMGRAALGMGIGLVCGLLSFTVRDYRTDSTRRRHWRGLEIRK